MRTQSAPRRCPWLNLKNPAYVEYHDQEWGRPVHDDVRLFEMLILEGAQAGLSWETILKKRENYRRAYKGFDPARVARFTEATLARLQLDPGLVRHRGKLAASVGNARAFRRVQKEFGSFDAYVWRFVGGQALRPRRRWRRDYPSFTPESTFLSTDLKARGFKFCGPTIVYAFMQACGLVNDHSVDCYLSRGDIRR